MGLDWKKTEFEKVRGIAVEAGKAILQVYESGDFQAETKADGSSLTKADLLSSDLILKSLKEFTPWPIVCEEATVEWSERKKWETFWLVDPLDGTKDFVSRTGEFTVNIALIHQHRSVWGAVYVPVLDELFWGGVDGGAYKNGSVIGVNTSLRSPIAVESGFHASGENTEFYKKNRIENVIKAGSSLKFCRIAEGKADVYLRMGPTCEWDTAAAQAVLEAAGGSVVALPERKALRYNRENIKNPFFLAANQIQDWVLD